RKAAACCQGEVQWLRDHASWFCDPGELMVEARWDLARARAWQAEVEGDAAALAAECRAIVGFHEQRLERVRRLEQALAVKPEETRGAQEALARARDRLAAAERRLSEERAKRPGQP